MLSLADEVTIHLYRIESPEGAAPDIERARNILDDAGYPLPVSSGEWGYSTYDPTAPSDGINFLPPVTPNRQASYYARMLLHNYSLGLRRSVIFKDLDAGDPDPGDIEHHWGLMARDLVPKPSYFAVSTLTELVGDAGPPEAVPLSTGKHGLRFVRPDGSKVTALWGEQEATWLLRAEGSGDARVLSRDGDDITPAGLSGGAQMTIESDDGPIYLIGDIAVTSVEQLDAAVDAFHE